MTAQRGALFVLKKGNEEPSNETFTAIGGMKTTNFSVSNRAVEVNTKESGQWRSLLEGAGVRSLSISGSGTFYDSAAEEIVRQRAFGGTIKNYQITFGNGDSLKGAFLITSYQRTGNMDNAEEYSITLESAGAIAFTVG